MGLPDLILSQLTDPFRSALLIGLLLTVARTTAVSGVLVPWAAGSCSWRC